MTSRLVQLWIQLSSAWVRKHLEKANTGGFAALPHIFQLLSEDIAVDLAPQITSEPALSEDAAYAREVMSSLTPEQFEKYGSGERTSATKIIQAVLKKVANSKTKVYIHHIGQFTPFAATVDPNAIKTRFF